MQVEALAIEQTFGAKPLLNVGEGERLAFSRRCENRAPAESISAIDEGERSEDCAGFAVGDMNAGNVAPFFGVVHAGQVVEKERSCMKVLECNGQIFG